MSNAKIFLIAEDGKNVREMLETPYEAEEVLQQLLVLKPDLLPGDQIDPEILGNGCSLKMKPGTLLGASYPSCYVRRQSP